MPTWGSKEIDLPDSPLDKIYNPSRKIHPLRKIGQDFTVTD